MTFRAPPPDLPPHSSVQSRSSRDTQAFDRRAVQVSTVGVGVLLVQSRFIGPRMTEMYDRAELGLDRLADLALSPEVAFGCSAVILLAAMLGIYLRRNDESGFAGFFLGLAASVAIAANVVIAWVLYTPISDALRRL